jgi:adenosylcobalamin-dependent ribonucleoside-triphosphate reductase
MAEASLRSKVITRRTYNRPLDKEGKVFETWEETVDRVIGHQRWLWERAGRQMGKTKLVKAVMEAELEELRQLMIDRKVLTSGRTLWLGGTSVAKRREASQFNCSFTHVETAFDVVDVLWLLLQGCGVGFRPIVGTLNGFTKPIKNIEVIRSTRTEKGGVEHNEESFENGIWTIKVGDSAEAWAKSIGKLLAGKHPAHTLRLDFSEIRPAGERLDGYGWISSGDDAIATAYRAIADLLNRRAGSLLTRMDILDLVNWLGTVLSSRRSAEIALFAYGEDEWEEFTVAKRGFYECSDCGHWDTTSGHCSLCGGKPKNPQRSQSNNSLLFRKRPTRVELESIFNLMVEAGGSEPGFINQDAATRRAPWFKGCNPCAEILLGNKSFCNLTEVDVGKYKGDSAGLQRAVEIAARANYRQTCVNLLDGILQEAWHLNNAFLRLCGVGLTGIATRPDLGAFDYQLLQRTATSAAYGMADELGLPRPKNVTTIKPSGTLSKIMDTTEGLHKPLGKYIFNNVNFSKHDPLVQACRAAGYKVFDNPNDPEGTLVCFPVKWDSVPFTKVGALEVNIESALVQLERYKMLMTSWCQQNVSATISYSVDEVPGIIDWLLDNWENYVGVSFLFRADPTKSAKDLGYLYLPQEVVTRETYENYVSQLQPLNLEEHNTTEELRENECVGGVCPIK